MPLFRITALVSLLALATAFSGCQKEQGVPGTISITQLPFVITNAGSYKVITDLTGKRDAVGIMVTTNNVEIDLQGKTLSGIPGARSGIAIARGVTNVAVQNGTVIHWPGGGLAAIFANQCRFKGLNLISNETGLATGCSNSITDCVAIRNNGPGLSGQDATMMTNCLVEWNIGDGITVGYQSVVENCVGRSNRINGIYVTIFGKIVRSEFIGNTRVGIRAGTSTIIEECKIIGNLYDGIEGANGVMVRSNLVEANLGNGIGVFGHATVTDNTSIGNARDGIRAAFSCRIINNICKFNGREGRDTAGIHVVLKGNKIEKNHVFVKNTVGIKTSAAPNQVVGNIVYQSETGPPGPAYDCKGGTPSEVLKRPVDPADPPISNYELVEVASGS